VRPAFTASRQKGSMQKHRVQFPLSLVSPPRSMVRSLLCITRDKRSLAHFLPDQRMLSRKCYHGVARALSIPRFPELTSCPFLEGLEQKVAPLNYGGRLKSITSQRSIFPSFVPLCDVILENKIPCQVHTNSGFIELVPETSAS
jgi:hypothetical protein